MPLCVCTEAAPAWWEQAAEKAAHLKEDKTKGERKCRAYGTNTPHRGHAFNDLASSHRTHLLKFPLPCGSAVEWGLSLQHMSLWETLNQRTTGTLCTPCPLPSVRELLSTDNGGRGNAEGLFHSKVLEGSMGGCYGRAGTGTVTRNY